MKKKKNCTYIGGQAVIQGVMMRGKSGMATVVRDDRGEIQTEAKRITPPEKRKKWLGFVFIRGVVNFFLSLVDGMCALLRSSEVAVADDDEAPPKLNRWVAENWKISVSDIATTVAVFFGIVIALALFLVVPALLANVIMKAAPQAIPDRRSIWYNLIEGGFRIVIFILYILFTLLFRSLRETYAYHGAEHKTINCYEYGMPLTVDNVRGCSRMHDRCGTTFLFIVMLISIGVFALVGWLVTGFIPDWNGFGFVLRFLVKLVFLPVVASVSYEILRFLARFQTPLLLPLKAPGYLLQKLTTREPTDGMIECAILAFNKVLEMDADPESPEKTFVTETKLSKLQAMMKRHFEEKNIDESDAEWILSLTLNVPRSDLSRERVVSRKECGKILALYEERLTGKPLWYIFGNTEFYGYRIEVDERVLIPRPETEILVQQAIAAVNEGDKVLDLCTGSGAIAIAIAGEAAKDKNVSVTAVDISDDALEVARNNVRINKVNVNLFKSDLFESVKGKFNLITANPPYVRTAEIATLQREVRDFEPRLALDGGEDGLEYYRRIASKINRYVTRGGMLILECGEDQAQQILKIFSRCDYAMVVKDLNGKERVVKIVF